MKITLKKHYDAILKERSRYTKDVRKEKDKALSAALISLNERLSLLNELRSGVATKEEVHSLEKVVDDLKTSRDKGEGRSRGSSNIFAIVIAVVSASVSILMAIITIYKLAR